MGSTFYSELGGRGNSYVSTITPPTPDSELNTRDSPFGAFTYGTYLTVRLRIPSRLEALDLRLRESRSRACNRVGSTLFGPVNLSTRFPLRGAFLGRLRLNQARLMAFPGIVIFPPREGLVCSKFENYGVLTSAPTWGRRLQVRRRRTGRPGA